MSTGWYLEKYDVKSAVALRCWCTALTLQQPLRVQVHHDHVIVVTDRHALAAHEYWPPGCVFLEFCLFFFSMISHDSKNIYQNSHPTLVLC